jgi:hypothetical protein
MEFSAPLYLKIFVFPIQAPDGEVVPLSFEHVAQNVAQDVSRKDDLAAQRRGDVEGGGGWEQGWAHLGMDLIVTLEKLLLTLIGNWI